MINQVKPADKFLIVDINFSQQSAICDRRCSVKMLSMSIWVPLPFSLATKFSPFSSSRDIVFPLKGWSFQQTTAILSSRKGMYRRKGERDFSNGN